MHLRPGSATQAPTPQPPTPGIFAPGIISGPVNDMAPTFTPDGKTVYFHRGGPGLIGVIMVSELHSGAWSRPEIASFSGQWQDIEPYMSPDGSYLIFSSNRPVVPGAGPLNVANSIRPWRPTIRSSCFVQAVRPQSGRNYGSYSASAAAGVRLSHWDLPSIELQDASKQGSVPITGCCISPLLM